MSAAAAPRVLESGSNNNPHVIMGAELAMQDAGLRENRKSHGSKVKTRVGRYALYEFILSSCLLIVAAAADASNSQSGRLIITHAGVPPIHMWIVRPILGFAAVALGTGIWRHKKCLNQYWLYRHFTAQLFLIILSLWSTISTCASINKFDVLNESSGFNYNLRVQMFFGAFLSALLAALGLAYLVSTQRNFTAYLAYEFDPRVDGFTDHDQYKLRGGRFWMRVLGCKRLPKEKREIIRDLELDGARAQPVPSAAANHVELDFDSSSSSAGDDSSSDDGSIVAPHTMTPTGYSSNQERGLRAVTPPLASAPPENMDWDAVPQQLHMEPIENEDMPVASPCGSGTPPLDFLPQGPHLTAPTPPFVDAGTASPRPVTPPLPGMLSAEAGTASPAPPVAMGLSPDQYEDLWESYARLGGFKADVSSNPSLGAICAHLQGCNLRLAASGTADGSSTVFAYIAELQPGEQEPCLVKVAFDQENQHLKITFKGPLGHDVAAAAAALRLSSLFGEIRAA